MFKIGDFSRIAHVTVKTLRYYAQEGLLAPVWIDRFTGYRYYALDQLPRVNRILALKDLGFTLNQIKSMINEGITVDELRGMLRAKKSELEKRLDDERLRLARVEKRLEQIAIEGAHPRREIILKPISGCDAAWAVTRAATLDQVEAALDGLQQTIRLWCASHHIRINGAWFSLIDQNQYQESKVDLHLAVPVESTSIQKISRSTSPVRVDRFEPVPLAACLLGSNEAETSQVELHQWVEENRLIPQGNARLVFLGEDPQTPLLSRMVELQMPVKREAASVEHEIYQKEMTMEPVKYETLPGFKVMGMKYRGKNEHQEIKAMWGDLNKRAVEIPMSGECAYGVCLMIANAPEGEFEYIAGFKVADGATPPEGMVVVDVPENRYAVFEHKGSLETLGKTYDAIINQWFPSSGLKPTGGYDMEVYDQRFDEFSADSIFSIYEPVK